MENLLTVLLIGVAILSIIPVINLNKPYEDKKYLCLKYLINVAFVWTILIFVQLLSTNITIIYYAHLLGIPIKFLLACLMVCTLLNYIEKKIPKILVILFYIFLGIELIIALTNQATRFYIDVVPSEVTNLADIVNANNGILFVYHLIISYSILLIGIGYMSLFLKNHRGIRQYKQITYTMIICIVVVLGFNLLQLFVIDTTVDLTYVSLVISAYLLYRVVYTKDMVFNLKTSGRGEILSNMREMYILTDGDKNIVEISSLLSEKYGILEEEYIGKKLDYLIKSLQDYIVFYSEYDMDQDDHEEERKDHFHLREKKFKLKGMNDYGYMVLLYDETQVFNLLRELNKLSNYDAMTGLHNRNYIEHKLDEINRKEKIGIISLDLNGLKVNNDYLGHERGDYLLKQLSLKMKEVMEKYEQKHIARIGGDEFIIVLENTTADILNTIKADILKQCEDDKIEKQISVSIGVSYSKESKDIFQLIQEADEDMYQMKRNTSKEYANEIVEFAKKTNKYIR